MPTYLNHHAQSYCKNPEPFLPRQNVEPTVRPNSELLEHLAKLAIKEQEIITTAIAEAGAMGTDVHLYRSPTSPFLGLAFIPGSGPSVKVWEH